MKENNQLKEDEVTVELASVEEMFDSIFGNNKGKEKDNGTKKLPTK